MTVILTITPQDANLQYEPSRGRKKEILISNGLEVVAVAGDFYVNKVMKPAVASAMTWSSTYVLLVLLIQPKNNLTGLDRITGN